MEEEELIAEMIEYLWTLPWGDDVPSPEEVREFALSELGLNDRD